MAVASARKRLEKKLSGEGSPGAFMSSMRGSAPTMMMGIDDRPALMIPGDGDIRWVTLLGRSTTSFRFFVTVCRESEIKRDRPLSTKNYVSSPEPKRFSMDIQATSETLLEKKPKNRRWMNRKAPPRKWTPQEVRCCILACIFVAIMHLYAW
jgi:hypothetical protein